MATANHMPQLKQYCSWMFKREDWEVTHLHKLIENEYENHTIQMPVLCMAAANHMPQLKQYCSWMFKREDWEVTHLHKLIEKEYENHTIQMPVI